MDPVSIIITIAICIAGLFVFYFALVAMMAAFMTRKAKKMFEDDDFVSSRRYR